jgi:hypothetical protein
VNRTAYSAVTVGGGTAAPLAFIKWYAAVQLQWQSNRAPMTPPATAPSNAW